MDALYTTHIHLGPGLLESVYGQCLEEELKIQRIAYVREAPIPLIYRGKSMNAGFRADFIVEGRLLLELKSVETLLPVHVAQVITYLRLAQIPLGLLVNFNVPLIKDGIRRVFNPTLP